MASLEDFDRQLSSLVRKGKLGSSSVQDTTDAAMANIASDSRLVASIFRTHKKASSPNKLISLYLIDAIAREARSRAKKAAKAGKASAAASPAAGSTTPTGSPPPDNDAPAKKEDGTYASFLKKLEAVIGKIVLDNWENGEEKHREKVRKVLDIWTKASTFSSSVLMRISQKLLASSTSTSASSSTAKPAAASPRRASPSPGLSPSPQPEAVPSTTAVGGGSAIPANVLALLAASSQTPPSAAALEQKKQADMESEVERVLREAREGAKGYSSFSPAPQPPSHSVPPPFNQYDRPPSSSYPPHPPPHSGYPSQQHPPPPPPSAAAGNGISLDPSQLAMLQQITRSASNNGSLPPGPPGPPHGQGGFGGPRPPPPPRNGSGAGWNDEFVTGNSNNGGGGNYGGPPQEQHQHQHRHQQQQFSRPPPPQSGPFPSVQKASYERPGAQQQRGQTRPYDEYNGGEGGYGGGEPPAKRPFQPQPPQVSPPQSDPAVHSPSVPPPAAEPSPAPEPTPTPAPVVPPTPTPQPLPSSTDAPTPTPQPFDPTTFTASSATSWSSFIAALRSSHPYFLSLPRPPSMEEVLTVCAPSAWMSLGPPQVAPQELEERERGWVTMVGQAIFGTMAMSAAAAQGGMSGGTSGGMGGRGDGVGQNGGF